ncbi:hypothetical protein ACOMHN_049155 [Nucella lapillus]
MTEWLNQYERVAQRQQQYLQKIRDLRHRLQTKDERYMMLSIERLRNTPRDLDTSLPVHKNPDYKSHVPWSSSLLAHSFYPRASCPSPRLVPESPDLRCPERPLGGSCACVVSGERLLPKHPPKHLAPLAPRKVRAERLSRSDLTLERNKTDYEPIETIAKRNRIHFSGYLTAGDDGVDPREDRDRKSGKNCGKERGQDASPALSVIANAGDVSQRDV